MIEPYLKQDKYFKGTNCSIYFDTKDKYLAMHSLEKPLYKEKIRVRSYNVPKSEDETVFVEIKKKFDGIGNKRRIAVKLSDLYNYFETGEMPTDNPQIKKELDYCFRNYNLKPSLFIAYDRFSYCAKDDPTFRLTFDHNVRSRATDLKLEHGDRGTKHFKNGEIVMEVKALDALPIWFVRAISKTEIYPASFSKYGRICQKIDTKRQGIIYRKENQHV